MLLAAHLVRRARLVFRRAKQRTEDDILRRLANRRHSRRCRRRGTASASANANSAAAEFAPGRPGAPPTCLTALSDSSSPPWRGCSPCVRILVHLLLPTRHVLLQRRCCSRPRARPPTSTRRPAISSASPGALPQRPPGSLDAVGRPPPRTRRAPRCDSRPVRRLRDACAARRPRVGRPRRLAELESASAAVADPPAAQLTPPRRRPRPAALARPRCCRRPADLAAAQRRSMADAERGARGATLRLLELLAEPSRLVRRRGQASFTRALASVDFQAPRPRSRPFRRRPRPRARRIINGG